MQYRSLPLALLLLALSACSAPAPKSPTSQPASQPAASRPSQAAVLAPNTIATLNIPYTQSTPEYKNLQSLDIYAPLNAKNAPVVLFVHGGGWTRSDKSEISAKPQWLNSHDILLVSVNYRLSPAVQHPAHVNDITAALRWTIDNISTYGGSPKKIFLMGHSAGSHLAALAAVHPASLASQKLSPTDIAGVISLDGSAFDIPERIEKGAPSLAENCRRAFGTSLENQRDGSPLYHANQPNLPPFLFIYIKEGGLNHTQSQTMADALAKSKNTATVLKSNAADHFTLDHELGAPTDPATPAILAFIQKYSATR